MALSIHRDIAAFRVQEFGYGFRSSNALGNFHMKLLFSNNERMSRRGTSGSCQFKFSRIKTTTTHCTAIDPVLSPKDSSYITTGQSGQMSKESTLILIRHGESLWNEKNLFSGCVDVPLTKKGIEEAIEAGKRIKNIPVDIIFTSALARAQMTAMLAMTQHRSNKVPIVRHDENEHAKIWSQIHSEDTEKQSIPVVKAWQLNERMYGELQGFNKKETAERYGKVRVHEWRRSYGTCPPNGESLEMCSRRAVAYFREHIEPQLLSGKHVMVAAHANSLRAIIMYIDGLTSEEVISLELSNGIPMLYIYKGGKFVRRGSPLGSTEAGVYAYTQVRGSCSILLFNLLCDPFKILVNFQIFSLVIFVLPPKVLK